MRGELDHPRFFGDIWDIRNSAVANSAVAIDDQYVYWVTEGAEVDDADQHGFPDGAIHRLAK